MSYADSLTEADEFLTYEEGRLQGMWDMRRLIWSELTIKTETAIDNSIQEQQTLVDEIRGEEE